MKNLKLDWNSEKVKAMIRTRGLVKGIVAVLVSSKLGGDYGRVVSGKSVDKIAEALPPSIGIYAVMPSCNPEEIVSTMLSLWDDPDLSVEPYTVSCDGIAFHKTPPDATLADIRTWAWRLFAEQNPVEIVEQWGRGEATA